MGKNFWEILEGIIGIFKSIIGASLLILLDQYKTASSMPGIVHRYAWSFFAD